MNKTLYNTAKRALDEADQCYLDDEIECGEIPDKADEILKHRLECDGQHVHTRCFWLDDSDADLDAALSETIDFCIKNKGITDYTVVSYRDQELVFVVYISKGEYNE